MRRQTPLIETLFATHNYDIMWQNSKFKIERNSNLKLCLGEGEREYAAKEKGTKGSGSKKKQQ